MPKYQPEERAMILHNVHTCGGEPTDEDLDAIANMKRMLKVKDDAMKAGLSAKDATRLAYRESFLTTPAHLKESE